jgi:Tfp pilus assembly protein PilF
VALDAGELELAQRAFTRGAALSPLRAAAFVNLSLVLERRGDLRGALSATERALLLEPRRGSAWASLVRLHAGAGDLARARALLDEAARRGVVDARLDALRRSIGP